MLDFIRERDEIYILSSDRLGRSSQDISDILEMIKKKGALINILNLPSFEDIQDPNLKNLLTNLVFEIQKYTAKQERQMILECQRQEIKIAKEKGVYKDGVVQYCKDSKYPKHRLIYETVVDLLERKGAGEAIAIKQIAEKVGFTRNRDLSNKEREEKA